MLLFYCAAEVDLAALRREGARGADLWTSLKAAREACDGLILVVEAAALSDLALDAAAAPGAVAARAAHIPPEAFANLDPYLRPKKVVAAGGYVVRPGDAAPEVLMIFRRGVWDLPKGKQDRGETIEACALREVREEVGVDQLHLGPALGTTLHGYERDGRYHVKTTYWFLMRTPETHFTPQAQEGIEEVAWVPWPAALRRIGYASIRHHMRQAETAVHEALRVA